MDLTDGHNRHPIDSPLDPFHVVKKHQVSIEEVVALLNAIKTALPARPALQTRVEAIQIFLELLWKYCPDIDITESVYERIVDTRSKIFNRNGDPHQVFDDSTKSWDALLNNLVSASGPTLFGRREVTLQEQPSRGEILRFVDHAHLGLPRAKFDSLMEEVIDICPWDQRNGSNRWRTSLQQEDFYRRWYSLEPSSRFNMAELVHLWLDRNQELVDEQQTVERYRVSLDPA